MWKYLCSWFSIETEFTKKWIARFTILISIIMLFYVFLSQELLFLHLTKGLSKALCEMMFNNYSAVVKVCVTGYAVTFVGSMAKAFMSKQQEEANKIKLQLQQCADAAEDDLETQDEDAYEEEEEEENE